MRTQRSRNQVARDAPFSDTTPVERDAPRSNTPRDRVTSALRTNHHAARPRPSHIAASPNQPGGSTKKPARDYTYERAHLPMPPPSLQLHLMLRTAVPPS